MSEALRLYFKRINLEALPHLRDLVVMITGQDAHQEGRELLIRNPCRADGSVGSFSINLDKGVWRDFASGDGGSDPISLVAFLQGHDDQGKAARWLADQLGIQVQDTPKTKKSKAAPTAFPRPVVLLPADVPPLPLQRSEDGRWEWRDGEGRLLKVTVRTLHSTRVKVFHPWTWCEISPGVFEWRSKDIPEPRPLFGLDRLAQRPEAGVIVVEGEKTATAAEDLFPDLVAVTSGSCESARKADWSPLAGRDVIVWPDADEPGAKYALAVESFLKVIKTRSLRRVVLPEAILTWIKPGKTEPGGWDLADAAPSGVNLQTILDTASTVDPGPHLEHDPSVLPAPSGDWVSEAVARLSALHPLEYEKLRTKEADRLGVRTSALDDVISQARKNRLADACKVAMFPEVKPWPDPMDPAGLLDEIHQIVCRFIVCEKNISIAATLWIAFTWFIDHVQVAPLAVITAPEKRCGKSQLLDVISRLSRRPLVASNISPAAVFRVIEAHSPTLLIDEADSFLKENEELRGIINSGHTRQSAYVIRTVGDDHEPRQFSTWGAKAISGIGHLSETLMDRAVVLTLRRKLPHETCQRLRHAENETFTRLTSMLARFAEDAGPSLNKARPELPEALNDRAQDNWEPLLAIADLAGDEWSERARATALNLSGAGSESISISMELLADIKDVFNVREVDKISTVDLLGALIADDLKSWSSYAFGKPITPRQLAKRLAEFGIESQDIKFHASGNVVKKGYRLGQFKDVFERYLAPSADATPELPQLATFEHPCGSSGSGTVEVAFESATSLEQVADGGKTSYHSATSKLPPGLKVATVADTEGTFQDGRVLRVNGKAAI